MIGTQACQGLSRCSGSSLEKPSFDSMVSATAVPVCMRRSIRRTRWPRLCVPKTTSTCLSCCCSFSPSRWPMQPPTQTMRLSPCAGGMFLSEATWPIRRSSAFSRTQQVRKIGDVGFLERAHGERPCHLEHAGDALRVVLVHLAPEGLLPVGHSGEGLLPVCFIEVHKTWFLSATGV